MIIVMVHDCGKIQVSAISYCSHVEINYMLIDVAIQSFAGMRERLASSI